MLYILYSLFFLACVVLIGTVLLQPGKTDAGALFTSNISSSAFGPRGTASVLSKITIVAASTFIVLAFLISMPALQGGTSVLQSVGNVPAETAPANADSTEPTPQTESGLPANDSNSPDANAPSGEANVPIENESGGEPANK